MVCLIDTLVVLLLLRLLLLLSNPDRPIAFASVECCVKKDRLVKLSASFLGHVPVGSSGDIDTNRPACVKLRAFNAPRFPITFICDRNPIMIPNMLVWWSRSLRALRLPLALQCVTFKRYANPLARFKLPLV